MKMLVNGVYDKETLKTLQELGVEQFGFDLRGSSPNLIPFYQLKEIFKNFDISTPYLIFSNDKEETIFSFLNLLEQEGVDCHLQFRDALSADYYKRFKKPFHWMLDLKGDWESILQIPLLRSVLIPVKTEFPEKDFWRRVEERKLEVLLHFDSLAALETFELTPELNVSVDLTGEIETSFRKVDLERLKKMKFWRKKNESTDRK